MRPRSHFLSRLLSSFLPRSISRLLSPSLLFSMSRYRSHPISCSVSYFLYRFLSPPLTDHTLNISPIAVYAASHVAASGSSSIVPFSVLYAASHVAASVAFHVAASVIVPVAYSVTTSVAPHTGSYTEHVSYRGIRRISCRIPCYIKHLIGCFQHRNCPCCVFYCLRYRVLCSNICCNPCRLPCRVACFLPS